MHRHRHILIHLQVYMSTCMHIHMLMCSSHICICSNTLYVWNNVAVRVTRLAVVQAYDVCTCI